MALQKKENILFAGILLAVIVALPLVASENIDCKGKAFHCVNSTHFKICVDLGGGVSTTVDDFLIPCPGNTVCKDDNNFECEYQITTILAPITQSDVTNDAGEENFTTVENFEVTTLSSDNKPSKLQEIRDDQNSMFTVEELNSNVASVNILNESFKFADVTTEPVKFNSVISFKSDNLSESATASSFQTLSVELSTDNSFSTTSEKVILSNNATNEKSIDKNLDLSFFKNDLSQSSSNSLNNGTNNFDNKVSLQFETSTLKDTLNHTNNTVDVINLTIVETSNNDDIYEYIQLTAPTSHIINEMNIVTTEEISDFEQLSTTLSSESHSGGISLKSLDSYNEKESNTKQIPNTTSNLFESSNGELESTTSVNNLIKTINTINEVITEQNVDLNSNILPKTSGTDFEINNETNNIGKKNHIKTNNDNVLTPVNTIILTTEKIQTASINISTFNATERKQNRNDFESILSAIVESELEVNNYTFMDEKINDNYNKEFSTVTNTEKYSSSSFSQTFTEFKTTDINTIDIKQTTVIYPPTTSPALVKNESEPNTEDPNKIIVNTEKYKQYTEAPTTLSHYSSTTVPEAVSLTNITTSNIEPTSVVDNASFTTLIPINYKQLQSNSDITLIERSTTFHPETYNDDVSMKNSDSNYSTTNFKTDVSTTMTTKEALESSTNNEFFTIASEQELFESTYLEKGTTERYELENQVTNKQPLTENESIFLAGQQLSYDISDRRIFLQLNNSQLSDSEILEIESSNITDLHSKISNNLNVIERNKSDKILRMSSLSPNLASYDKISNSTNTTTDLKLMGVNKNLNTLNANINYSSDNATSNNTNYINDIEKLEHLGNNISTNIKSLENIKSNTTELKSVNIDINRIPPKVKPIYLDKFIESSVTEIILPLEPTSTTEAYFTQNEKHFGIMDNVNTTLDVIGFSTTEDIRKNDGNFSEGVTELFEFSSNVSKYNNKSRLEFNLSNNSMTFQNGQENGKKKFIEYFSLPNTTSANETVGNGIPINDINTIDKAYIESFNSEDPSFLNSKVASSELSNDTFNSLQSSVAENNLLIENFKNFDVTVEEAPYIQTEKQSLSDINALPSNNAVNYITTTTAILTKKDIKGNVTNEVTESDEHNLHNFTKNVPKFISNIIYEFGLEKITLNHENKYNLTSTEFENLLNKSSEVKLKHNVPSQDFIGIIEEENILHNTSILDTEYAAGTIRNHSTNINNFSTFSQINNTVQDNINQLHVSGQNIERHTQNFFSPPIEINETFVAMKNINRTNNIFSLNNGASLSVPQYPLKNRPSLKDIEEGQIKTNDVNNTESTITKLEKNNSSVPKLHRENETLHVNQVLVTMNNNTVDILNSTITKVTDLLNADISSQTFKNSSNDNLLENRKIFISNGFKNKSLPDENISTVSFTEKTTKDTNSGYNDTIQNSVVKQNIIKVNFTSPKQIISQSNLLLANYSQLKISLQDKVNKSFEKSSAKVFSMNETNVTEMKGLIQFDCLNRSRGKYSDENNCRNFYICVGKHEPITGTCPVGTVFSELNKQCTKNLSHCIRNNQFRCLSAGRFIDILSQEFYYICVKKPNGYVRYKLQCQKGYYLDKANIQCTLNSENSKESSTNTSDRSTNERKSSESLSSNNEEKFKCKKEGKFEYPDDCRKYYVCTERNENELRRKIKKCDSDKVFNREKRKCVDADSYEC